jgi:hypothetical protein
MLVLPLGVLCVRTPAQETPAQDAGAKDAPASESKGLPPRATPADYQAHTQAGTLTLAADFVRHSVPTPEATYSTEDFVVVETGLFGPPEARLKLSIGDFSLRINGKKMASPSQPYGLSFSSLKDPEWEPPSKPKGSKPTRDATAGAEGLDAGRRPCAAGGRTAFLRASRQAREHSLARADLQRTRWQGYPRAPAVAFIRRAPPRYARRSEESTRA